MVWPWYRIRRAGQRPNLIAQLCSFSQVKSTNYATGRDAARSTMTVGADDPILFLDGHPRYRPVRPVARPPIRTNPCPSQLCSGAQAGAVLLTDSALHLPVAGEGAVHGKLWHCRASA